MAYVRMAYAVTEYGGMACVVMAKNRHGLYSYGRCRYGLCSHGLCSYGPIIAMADVVMA